MSDSTAFLETLVTGDIEVSSTPTTGMIELQVVNEVSTVVIDGADYIELGMGQLNASVYVTTDAIGDPNIALLPPGTPVIQIT